MARRYRTMNTSLELDRRELIRTVGVGAAVVGGVILGVPSAAQEKPAEVETNIADFMKAPRAKHSLPGPFPGRVVKVSAPAVLKDEKVDPEVAAEMVEQGIRTLTGQSMRRSFKLFFTPDDIIGIKVNPVGPPLIHTKPEIVEAVIAWLTANHVSRRNIVMWDRFEGMLKDAGYTAERFPGVHIEGLQTMDEEGSSWKDANGNHVSAARFDQDVYYLAKGVLGKNVRGYKDDEYYRNQHVFTGEYSYYGKLLTQRLTKIINIAAYKNTGNGISMATKNVGYAAVCNTGRLHVPLFFKVCTEVLAAPVVRDKMVLTMIDGIRGQFDGGPDKNEKFCYPNCALYVATDPFAADMVGHRELVAKRKAMGVTVNEHPRFTEYLYYAEKLGLGVVSEGKLRLVEVKA